MSIGNKIALSFALVVVVFATVNALSYRNASQLIEHNRWVRHTHAVLHAAETAQSTLRDTHLYARSYIITGDPAELANHRTAQNQLMASLEEIAQLTNDNPIQQRRLGELRSAAKERAAVIEELAAERNPNDVVSSLTKFGGERVNLAALKAQLDTIMSDEDKLLLERNKLAEDTAQAALVTIAWSSVFALALVVVVATLVTRAVTGPVRALVIGADQIGSGNLGHRIAVHTSDELGKLGDAFNRMTESLSSTMVSADAEKRARARIEGLLQTISETAANLVSATSEILAGTTQQAAGAQEQAAAVAQTVTTVNQVVQTSEQAAERAKNVAEISNRSLEYTRAGRKVVDDSIQYMQTVKDQVESSAESILALAEQAQAIGDIINSVNEIAEQTNLLALNASIEASRAGEHGKGFGVVATEVKALADQSKKATAQVRQILTEIQRATSSAVMATEECTKSVSAASKVIAQAGDNIRALADIIDQAAQSAAQIAASAGQQAAGTAQIHQAMKNINQVTNQNLSSTRQMEQAAKDLNVLGGRLRDRLVTVERGAIGSS